LEERPRSELFSLAEASIQRPRLGLLSELSRLEVAGRALSWVRRAAPPRTPEPEAWNLLERLLDRLATPDALPSPERELCELGLPLLSAFGWGIDFERCVSCGDPFHFAGQFAVSISKRDEHLALCFAGGRLTDRRTCSGIIMKLIDVGPEILHGRHRRPRSSWVDFRLGSGKIQACSTGCVLKKAPLTQGRSLCMTAAT